MSLIAYSLRPAAVRNCITTIYLKPRRLVTCNLKYYCGLSDWSIRADAEPVDNVPPTYRQLIDDMTIGRKQLYDVANRKWRVHDSLVPCVADIL